MVNGFRFSNVFGVSSSGILELSFVKKKVAHSELGKSDRRSRHGSSTRTKHTYVRARSAAHPHPHPATPTSNEHMALRASSSLFYGSVRADHPIARFSNHYLLGLVFDDFKTSYPQLFRHGLVSFSAFRKLLPLPALVPHLEALHRDSRPRGCRHDERPVKLQVLHQRHAFPLYEER
jgi:hypothetical protein